MLVLALTALISGHGLLRADLAGTAKAISVPEPPRPGDCVLSAPDPVVPLTTGPVVSPAVVFGPCRGMVAGEIVSVRSGPPVPDGSVGAIMGTSGECWAAAARYVGFTTSQGVAELPAALAQSVGWRPELGIRGQTVGADGLQKAVGRDWSGCLVRPHSLAVYPGSVHGALRYGRAPDAYGDCSPSADPSVQSSVSCDQPHPAERLGWTMVPAGSVSPAGLDASCRAFAGRLLRTSDPTYSGALDVVASSGNVTICTATVRGAARLGGTLIGIGFDALPLTP